MYSYFAKHPLHLLYQTHNEMDGHARKYNSFDYFCAETKLSRQRKKMICVSNGVVIERA